jgi:hypothetical protein
MIESPSHRWTPVWAMPNVTLDEPIEASHAALVPSHDHRVLEFAKQEPVFAVYLKAFRNEFGTQFQPTIGLAHEDARKSVFTVTAFGGFRDAVCMSAVITGQTRTLQWGHPQGVLFSDAFDVYPWFPSTQWNGHVMAFTPALKALHSVNELRPQSAPALGKRSLSPHHLDEPLLTAIVDRWERCFAAGNESVEDRRLFRALDMARAASKSPGGVDASEFDAGRSVSLWVSAFETLAHDERYSDFGQVIALLNRVEWLMPTLKTPDRDVSHKGNPLRTNRAGELYRRFHYARTAFLHGNPLTDETLTLGNGKSILPYAGPLFRMALTAYLSLTFPELPSGADETAIGSLRWRAYGIQRAAKRLRGRHIVDALIASLDEKIIRPAEAKFVELLMRKPDTMGGEHI